MNNLTNYQKIIDFFSKSFNRPQHIIETWLIGALDDDDFHPFWLRDEKCEQIFTDSSIKNDWEEEFFDLEKKFLNNYDLEKQKM